MTFEQFIDEWAGKDWKNHTWEKDEIGVFQYKTGLCDRFCACLLTLVDVLNYQGKTDLKIRVIL